MKIITWLFFASTWIYILYFCPEITLKHKLALGLLLLFNNTVNYIEGYLRGKK
jgi:hypothetical protein